VIRMQIDILSDLHFDYYFIYKNGVDENQIIDFFNSYFNNDSECLIIAGDLGHYNDQNIEIIKILKKHYYKYIICVLGNHDYYLFEQKSISKFKAQSLNKVDEMRKLLNNEDGIYCLNGNIVAIEGIKFGGADGWYDGSYVPKYWKNQPIPDRFMWKQCMGDDARFIRGVEHYTLLFEIEKSKIEKVYKECDVMITHVNPSNLNRHLSPKYLKQQSNGFFCFDGEKYLKEGSMKYWVFGHTHDAIEYSYPDSLEETRVQCICHPLGTPNEDNGSDQLIKTIKINEGMI